MEAIVPILLFLLMTIPLVLQYTSPRTIAPLAFLPLAKEKSIPLTPNQAAALFSGIAPGAGYRAPATAQFDLTSLFASTVVEAPEATLLFFPERSEIVARRRWTWVNKARPLVRIQLRAESDRVFLRARWFVWEAVFLPSFFLVAPSWASAKMDPGMVPVMFGMGAFAAGLSLVFSYFPARTLLETAEREVRTRIAHLTA